MTKHLYLANFLRTQRLNQGLTPMQLARHLESLDPRIVFNWEAGLHVPPASCFPKLIQFLNIDRKELVEAMAADTRAALEKPTTDSLGPY